MEQDAGSYHRVIESAFQQGKISEEEYKLVKQIKQARNKLFHENHYALFWQIEGIEYPISEDETKQKLCKEFQKPILKLVAKYK